MIDLLNEFQREADRRQHLKCYSSLIRRARPYTLDDDSVHLITELASAEDISSKLASYRRLARLPFEVVWIEMDYAARFAAMKAAGSIEGDMPEDAPLRIGWLLQQITDTSWRSVSIVQYDPGLTESGRSVDAFAIANVVSTEGPLENFYPVSRDPEIREAVTRMNGPAHAVANSEEYDIAMGQVAAWGLGSQKTGKKLMHLPEHLIGSNAIDLPLSWEPIIEKVSAGMSRSKKVDLVMKHMAESMNEVLGDLRFLCTALATLNNVPLTYEDFRRPGTRMIAGGMKPYMINRLVRIGLPKTLRRTKTIKGMLKLAERSMRRHEVSGYWKNVRCGPGRSQVKKTWVTSYWRGDASLGFVNQEREVFKV